MKIIDFVELLRLKQWYKNIVVFIPIIFAFQLFDLNFLFLTLLGFIALCLISSSYYIINDLKDVQEDKIHPEKRLRPLASRKIRNPENQIGTT